MTKMMQMNRGAATADLNAIRNHIDQLKAGKISRLFSKARLISIIITDANHCVENAARQGGFMGLMKNNFWLHNLPDCTSYKDAVNTLQKYNAWNDCPASIRDYLLKADPQGETVKYEEYKLWHSRVYGIMPRSMRFLLKAKQKASELGYNSVILNNYVNMEARHAAAYVSGIANNIEIFDEPIKKPAALFSTGEMIVTVADNTGIGGRNQEFVLAAAQKIAGSKNIVIASADTDGTDGPGGLKIDEAPDCLGGGIADGYTMEEAKIRGIDIGKALETHSTSEILWKLGSGMHIEHCISLVDLTVLLIRSTET
jgi:glycerate-2-kinase